MELLTNGTETLNLWKCQNISARKISFFEAGFHVCQAGPHTMPEEYLVFCLVSQVLRLWVCVPPHPVYGGSYLLSSSLNISKQGSAPHLCVYTPVHDL